MINTIPARRMRTLQAGYAEIKAQDPDTCLTEYALRQMLLDGTIPTVRVGSKRLFDVSTVWEYITPAEKEV